MAVKRALIAMMAVTAVILQGGAAWATERVRLTSLEWPPYSGADLPSQGAAVEAARVVFDRLGVILIVDFFPWQRAVQTVRDGHADGYFPEYGFETREFVLSAPIGSSPLGFVETAANPVAWQTLDDVATLRMGVVSGYVNTTDLDRRIAARQQIVEVAMDDLTNLRKLAVGRLDLAVIDPNVLSYLMATDPKLHQEPKSLRMNNRMLETKTLHIAFNSKKADLAHRFNRALKEAGVDKVIADYISLNGF